MSRLGVSGRARPLVDGFVTSVCSATSKSGNCKSGSPAPSYSVSDSRSCALSALDMSAVRGAYSWAALCSAQSAYGSGRPAGGWNSRPKCEASNPSSKNWPGVPNSFVCSAPVSSALSWRLSSSGIFASSSCPSLSSGSSLSGSGAGVGSGVTALTSDYISDSLELFPPSELGVGAACTSFNV